MVRELGMGIDCVNKLERGYVKREGTQIIDLDVKIQVP